MNTREKPTATAWLRTERGMAIICAWCPDRGIAELRAREAGLPLSHGICRECAQKQFHDAAEVHGPATPPARAGAAESTPTGGAGRVVSLGALARVTGLSSLELAGALGARLGRLQVRRDYLPDLISELATSGRWRAAARLVGSVEAPDCHG